MTKVVQNTPPQISAIIVSYNTRELTRRCLHTLLNEAEREGIVLETWLVDNASRDGSAEMVRAEFPQVHLIASDENLGFGRANNAAMEQATAPYFLLLNSDAFLEPGALTALLNFAAAHPRAAVVGPKLLNGDGSLQPSCWKFPSPTRVWLENLGVAALMSSHPHLGDYHRWAHDEERAVDFLSGACLLVRRESYEEIGGFDSRFFLYAEETDWQKRMSDAGWQILFTPQASVVHLGGASGVQAEDNAVRMSRNSHFWTGLDRFGRKHYGTRGLVLSRAGMVVGSLIRLSLWLGMAWLNPKRSGAARKTARARAKLHGFLLWRQLTHPAPR